MDSPKYLLYEKVIQLFILIILYYILFYSNIQLYPIIHIYALDYIMDRDTFVRYIVCIPITGIEWILWLYLYTTNTIIYINIFKSIT